MKQPLGILFGAFGKLDIFAQAISVIYSRIILNIPKVKCCRAPMLSSYTWNFYLLILKDFNKLHVQCYTACAWDFFLILYIERSI